MCEFEKYNNNNNYYYFEIKSFKRTHLVENVCRGTVAAYNDKHRGGHASLTCCSGEGRHDVIGGRLVADVPQFIIMCVKILCLLESSSEGC
jgi:hypothetical protein